MNSTSIENIKDCRDSLATQIIRLNDVLRGIPHVNKDDDPIYAGVGAQDMEKKIRGICISINEVIKYMNGSNVIPK